MSGSPYITLNPSLYPPSEYNRSHSRDDTLDFDREITRTPSPTPSEVSFLKKKGLGNSIDWRNFRKYFARKYLVKWIVIIFIITISIVTSVLAGRIIKALEPFGNKLKSIKGGWLIPVAMQVILAFPPLIGRELIQTLCGVVWGVGVGFAIVMLATTMGELAVFLSFRYFCRVRAKSWQDKDMKYGILARVVQEGGILFMIVARFSALPPSFSTVVFAVCDTQLWKFLLAVIITLPSQFSNVYFGVATRDDVDHKGTTAENVANIIVITASIIFTVIAERYISKKVDKVKPSFIYERRKARQKNGIRTAQKVTSRDHLFDGSSNEYNIEFPVSFDDTLSTKPVQTPIPTYAAYDRAV